MATANPTAPTGAHSALLHLPVLVAPPVRLIVLAAALARAGISMQLRDGVLRIEPARSPGGERCPHCGGTGLEEDAACEFCNGTGRAP